MATELDHSGRFKAATIATRVGAMLFAATGGFGPVVSTAHADQNQGSVSLTGIQTLDVGSFYSQSQKGRRLCRLYCHL